LRLGADEVVTIERREAITLRGQTLPLVALEQLFELRRSEADRSSQPQRRRKRYVVVVGVAQHRIGLLVDELIRQQDIVIKSLGKALANLSGIAGATELGGQQTVLVLDVAAIVEEATAHKRVEAA
jgi:two-component system chemotaxis sensor kinase CheA